MQGEWIKQIENDQERNRIPKGISVLFCPDFLNQVITIGYQLMNKGRLLLRVRLIYNCIPYRHCTLLEISVIIPTEAKENGMRATNQSISYDHSRKGQDFQ